MSFNGWQGQIETKRLAVVLTRRELLAGAIAISGSTLVAKASPSRSVNPEFKSAMTTLFWVGERSNAENNFIPNHESYWDTDWQTSYGGVDDPEHRNGYWPAGFRPKENPFYVALPYGEFSRLLKDFGLTYPLVPFRAFPALKEPLGADRMERTLLLCAIAGRRTVR